MHQNNLGLYFDFFVRGILVVHTYIRAGVPAVQGGGRVGPLGGRSPRAVPRAQPRGIGITSLCLWIQTWAKLDSKSNKLMIPTYDGGWNIRGHALVAPWSQPKSRLVLTSSASTASGF